MIDFPHVRFIGDINTDFCELYYLGGDPMIICQTKEIVKFIIGKLYRLRTVLYSESSKDERCRVWICDVQSLTYAGSCIVNLEDFGTLSDLRDKKIDKIIE